MLVKALFDGHFLDLQVLFLRQLRLQIMKQCWKWFLMSTSSSDYEPNWLSTNFKHKLSKFIKLVEIIYV